MDKPRKGRLQKLLDESTPEDRVRYLIMAAKIYYEYLGTTLPEKLSAHERELQVRYFPELADLKFIRQRKANRRGKKK